MDPKLYQAATSGSTISLFSQRDSDFFLQETPEKNSALHLAVKSNQKQFAKEVINLHPELLYHANSKGDTPLHIAARVGCLEIIKLLTNRSSAESQEVEAQKRLFRMVNLQNDTALHDAVRNGHFEIVKLLIQEDRELTSLTNKNGESPLFVAVDRNRFDIASHILEAAPTCSYQGRNNMNVLHAAIIRHCSHSFIDVWIQGLKNSSYFIYQLLTPTKLTFSLLKEVLDTFKLGTEADFMGAFIQQHPIAITEADEFGWTPIHYAAYLHHMEAVQLLLKKDRHIVYMKDKEGMSALHIAAKEGHVDVMRQLITICPDTCELLDYRGRTALHVAAESGKVSAVKYVLKTPGLEGLINEQDKEGNTPLHLAAVHGCYDIVSMLSDDNRVDKGALNKEGFAAIEIIISYMELRRFQKVWIAIKLVLARGLPSLKGAVIREHTETKNVEMKEQPQHIERKEEPTENLQEIEGTSLDRKGEPIEGTEVKNFAHAKKGDPTEIKDAGFRRLMDLANTHLLVATIIATVTFAAGFTMSSGPKDLDQGMSILSKKFAFRSFWIADTVAFYCSAASMLMHFWASMATNKVVFLYFIRFATILTFFSIMGMVIAFIFGTNVVLAGSSGLATANLAMGCCFFIVLCIWCFS